MTAKTPQIDVIILAAGLSRRMGSLRKQYQEIDGVPVYQRAIASFRDHQAIGQIILVVPEDDFAEIKARHSDEALTITIGGAERHDSVACGLEALAGLGAGHAPYIAIHDAARPTVPAHVIDKALAMLGDDVKAVIPVLPVADTIKQIDASQLQSRSQTVSRTLDRSLLRRVQTPQIFAAALIRDLHAKADYHTLAPTDDASLAEAAGIAVHMIDGDEALAKLTWPSDLTNMRAALMRPPNTIQQSRTGTGFDVHRFKDSTNDSTGPIMICGLAVEHDRELEAHSDGDVGIHALCDAIFGALCDGDIGMHFPPSDAQWRDASSDQFLTYAVDKIAKAGGHLVHVDVTILCERPKIGPHRDAMRAILADLCGLPLSAVSVKATTTERLGFTGRGDGIAAQAAATITLPPAL